MASPNVASYLLPLVQGYFSFSSKFGSSHSPCVLLIVPQCSRESCEAAAPQVFQAAPRFLHAGGGTPNLDGGETEEIISERSLYPLQLQGLGVFCPDCEATTSVWFP